MVLMWILGSLFGALLEYPMVQREVVAVRQGVAKEMSGQLATHLLMEGFADGQIEDLIRSHVEEDEFVDHIAVLNKDAELIHSHPGTMPGWKIASEYNESKPVVFDEKYHLRIERPIERGSLRQGTLVMWGKKSFVRERILRQLGMSALGSLLALGAGLLLLPRIAKWLTRPAIHLAETAEEVAQTKDYSLRASKFDDDEFGVLTDHFNGMMGTIEDHYQVQESERQQDRMALSRTIKRAERLESIGHVAGGVAHDLNNILGPMVALPELIAQQIPDNADAREDLGLLSASARKAAAVIKDLLTLARRADIQLSPLSLNGVVRETLASLGLRERMRSFTGVTVVSNMEVDLPSVSGSDSHLNRVVLNLVLNAAEAYEDVMGEVTVRTRKVSLKEPSQLFEEVPAGEYVVLSVADRGQGIPNEDFERILEPFFSRKSGSARKGGSGSGLGLSVVYGVVKDHEGFLHIESTVGQGTRFEIYLPAGEAVLKEVHSPPAPIFDGEGLRALVIDDDEGQRHLSASLLGRMGFEVEVATTGREGVEQVAGRKDSRFDLIILDMVMEEDFDGLETLREILRLQPTMRVIIVTGYAQSERVREAQALSGCACLPKPFTREHLSMSISRLFDSESASSDNAFPQISTS